MSRSYVSSRRIVADGFNHILAACEPLLASMYWKCCQAKSEIEDRRANETSADSWYLNSALRADGKDGGQ